MFIWSSSTWTRISITPSMRVLSKKCTENTSSINFSLDCIICILHGSSIETWNLQICCFRRNVSSSYVTLVWWDTWEMNRKKLLWWLRVWLRDGIELLSCFWGHKNMMKKWIYGVSDVFWRRWSLKVPFSTATPHFLTLKECSKWREGQLLRK